MVCFTGWQYLLIDAANTFGLDKLLFEERIEWAEKHLDKLEEMVINAETKPLFYKAVQAIRKAQKGLPSGHLVGLDACNSGVQIMSALTGCVAGATATGLVDPAVRADAYSKTTEVMNEILHHQGISLDVPRDDAKAALMTSFYGSKKTPEDIFGKDTPELMAFHQAAMTVAPGAWELLQDLLASWQPFALYHSWKMPDGYDVKVKVMKKKETRIEVDELDHATFTYQYFENQGERRGLSNAANVVHSVDAYVLRSIHRRCNYDRAVAIDAQAAILDELELRYQGYTNQVTDAHGKLAYYLQQYERSDMVDVTIMPYIKDGHDTQYLSTLHLEKLSNIIFTMLDYKPFPVIAIHDEFKCHPNNMNHLRQQYINIFAEIAESNILSDILTQIHGQPGVFPKLSQDLGEKIRGSNYALS
jgi:hypothetical protein